MGRVLALDPGTVRIGAALSDPLWITAQPLESFDAGDDDLMTHITQIVREHDVECIVVGLPVSLDGSEGDSARAARAFAADVHAATGVPIETVDERFSSVIADRAMIEAGARRAERRAKRDRVAAAVFLQSYLDGRR